MFCLETEMGEYLELVGLLAEVGGQGTEVGGVLLGAEEGSEEQVLGGQLFFSHKYYRNHRFISSQISCRSTGNSKTPFTTG
jgi:hypothetical protein